MFLRSGSNRFFLQLFFDMSKRSAEDPLLPERPAVQTICVFVLFVKWQSNLCLKYISVLVCGGLPVQEQRFQKFSSNANGYCMMEYCTGSILMSMERRKWSSVVLKRLQSLLLLFFGFVFNFEQKREQVFECPIYQLPGPPLRPWHRYGPWIAMKWRRSAPTRWTTSSFPWLSGIRPFANCSAKNRTAAGYYRFLAGLS